MKHNIQALFYLGKVVLNSATSSLNSKQHWLLSVQTTNHHVTTFGSLCDEKTTQSLLEQNQKLRRFSESSADVSGNSSASLKQLWFTHSSFTEAVLKWVRTQCDGRCDQKALPDWHLAKPTLSHLLIHLSGLVGVFSSVCSLFTQRKPARSRLWSSFVSWVVSGLLIIESDWICIRSWGGWSLLVQLPLEKPWKVF